MNNDKFMMICLKKIKQEMSKTLLKTERIIYSKCFSNRCYLTVSRFLLTIFIENLINK